MDFCKKVHRSVKCLFFGLKCIQISKPSRLFAPSMVSCKDLSMEGGVYCESSAFTVKIITNASTSPLAGQPVLMHINSHAGLLS